MKKEVFLKKWEGHIIDDWCTVVSDDFKAFARSFRSYMGAIAKTCDASIVKFHIGHYDLSGFLQKDEKFCYFSYSVPRHLPIQTKNAECVCGVLYREANDTDDYHGGANHFTSLADMDTAISRFLAGLAAE
ncbi:MAG: hypothetical protein LUE86_14090 [Clostridiales bacterium]|nr:hypothetical protein [Clostridiales bacterium]